MARIHVSGQFSLTRLSLCLGLAFGGGGVWAQEAPAAAPGAERPVAMLKEVVISGSRVEQDIDEVPATITTIGTEKIARENPSDLDDLLKGEAGVSVRVLPYRPTFGNSSGRGGNEGVNIRGLEGDQVRLQIDGVSMPSAYSNGPQYLGRGDTLEPEGYKRVEILRGASSTQYGSDGLAGAVSFVTKDPEDLLHLGKSTQFNLKAGYTSADNAWQLAPSFAFKGDTVQGLVLASMRRGYQAETMGTNESLSANRTAANPTDYGADYLLAKLVFTPDRTHQIKLTAESGRRDTHSDVLSARGGSTSTLLFDARDDAARDLLKLDYRYTPANTWFDVLTASMYNQKSSSQQYTLETRSVNPLLRTRDRNYTENAWGSSVQVESNFGQDTTHRVVSGVDVVLTDITSLNTGRYTPRNVALTGCTGSTVSNCQPFPDQKAFPDTTSLTFGAFLQDEINFGAVSITPGVRYDAFRLTPRSDALYRVNNTVEPSELNGSALSPRLGAIWKLDPSMQLFGQYAHGFRAPKADQVNGGTTNLASNYMSVGNSDLKPETSDTLELGLRGKLTNWRYSVAMFYGDYKDFITNQIVSGAGTALSPSVYQSINLSKATIGGYELRGDWDFAANWNLTAAYAHAHGDSYSGGVATPLKTIDPDKLIVGLSYTRGAQWGLATQLTAVERKARNPVATNVTPEGYTVADVSGWYNFSKATRLTAGIGNLFDRKYVEWADVRDLAATSTIVDAYSQPGRNFKVSVTHSF